MTVWIEYAVVQNFITDFALLYLTNRTMRTPIVRSRLFVAAALGAAFALIFPLFSLPKMISVFVRLIFGAVLCLIGVRIKGGGNWIARFLFYLYAFVYGGALFGLYSLFDLSYSSLSADTLAGVALALLPFFTLVCLFFVGKILRRLKKIRQDYVCALFVGTEKVRLNGLLDTGNSLLYKGCPVCLISKSVQDRLKNRFPIQSCMTVRTATDEGILPIFQGGIEIYSERGKNIIDRVYFAVSPQPLGGEYEVVLHPKLLEEEDHAERIDS